MSSVIELYEHNQKAYDALLDMLGERDRACIIKPTGTGKFVIIAKMVQDNPDKRFLLLGTNDYMFNDQMANLAEIAPGFTPENLQFMTYAAAMGMERRNDCVPPYDVIIADEFHHCGAEEWGKGVTHILNANESAKVVGFTATPIRYSDGGRNMADEMFDGNVAYSMELEEAWLRGILPIPKYVTAFYEAPEELGRLAKSIAGLKNERVMKRFQKKYEQLRRSLTEAGGVREIIAKHLEKRNAKVIVFCPRIAKLREFMLLRREWFGAVNSEIHAYKTVSADPCTNQKRWAHHMWMTREAYGHNKAAIADVQPQNEVDVKPGKYRDRKRTRDGYQGAHGHLAYDFGLILGDILVYCYREHVRYRSFLTREGTPVDTGLEVHGSTHDDGTADNHGEGTGELTAAALHTVLDGKAKVHKAEDDEDAAEGGHTIREKVFHVFQHG